MEKNKIHKAEPYCVKCKVKMELLGSIGHIAFNGWLDFYVCPKCKNVSSENNRSKIYWSNYEWLYKEEEKEW